MKVIKRRLFYLTATQWDDAPGALGVPDINYDYATL